MKSLRQFHWMCLLITSIVAAGCGAKNGGQNQGEAAPATGAGETESASADTQPSAETKAVDVVDRLAGGDYAGVSAMFDAKMKASLPESMLPQTWQTLTVQVGQFKSRGSARTATEGGYDCVYVPCSFERGSLNAKVVFDAQGKIAGIFFQ